jgi:hypothetical protein
MYVLAGDRLLKKIFHTIEVSGDYASSAGMGRGVMDRLFFAAMRLIQA